MTTALSDRRNGPFAVQPGQRLLGEIITWNCSGVSLQYTDLIDALKSADLNERVARELAPRHAFARACKKLQQARIIRQACDDATAKDGKPRFVCGAMGPTNKTLSLSPKVEHLHTT